ncbi:DUF805 domain-containing protein [Humibacter ginsengisoli]
MSYTPPPSPPYSPPNAQVPLELPHYGASLPVAFRRFWKKYATFTGRASRSEYWWWALCNAIVYLAAIAIGVGGGIATGIADAYGNVAPGPIFAVYPVVGIGWFLATLVGNLAITWRRLHDANLAGPFFFLGFIPYLGGIVVLILALLPSSPMGGRFDAVAYGVAYPQQPYQPYYPQQTYQQAPYPPQQPYQQAPYAPPPAPPTAEQTPPDPPQGQA